MFRFLFAAGISLCFLFSSVQIGTSGLTTVSKLEMLQDIPFFVKSIATSPRSSRNILMGIGEAEGIPFRLLTFKGIHLRAKYMRHPVPNVELKIFRILSVPGYKGGMGPIYDVMVPLDPGASFQTENEFELLWCKIQTSKGAKSGQYTFSFSFTEDPVPATKNMPISLEAEFPVSIQPVEISIDNSLTIQARVSPRFTSKNGIGILRLLAKYNINSAAAVINKAQIQNIDIFRNFARVLFEDLGFKNYRLTSTMNPKKERMTKIADVAQWLKTECRYINSLNPVLKDPRWAGRFSWKLWDEPDEFEYPFVIQNYVTAKYCAEAIKLELGEQPAAELMGLADIYTASVRFLDREEISAAQQRGAEVWLYANKLHGINQRPGALRFAGWIMWLYNLNGYHFWTVNWWNRDPWTTISEIKIDFLKRGTLIYPSNSKENYFSSLRLEAFRDGIEDLNLLNMAARVKEEEKKSGSKANISEFLEKAREKIKEVNIRPRVIDTPPLRKWHDILLKILTSSTQSSTI